MKKHHVFPEAIPRDDLKPGPWEIRNNASGSVNLVEKTMTVPLIDMPCPCGVNHAESMRLHEYGHIAFTPVDAIARLKKAGLDKDLVNGCEDARLYTRLNRVGLDVVAPVCAGMIATRLTSDLQSGNFTRLMTDFAGAFGSTQTHKAARDWVTSIADFDPALAGIAQVMQSAIYHLDRLQNVPDPPVFDHALDCARELQQLITIMNAVMNAIKEQAAKAEEEGEDEIEVEEYGTEIPGYSGEHGLWGRMQIQRPPLNRPARAAPQRKWTARDEGTIPTSIHRLSVDGRIFKQAAHKYEGLTVLVDCSGSMDWDWSDLQELLDKLPATTVALYSGAQADGALRIVAEKGKKADKKFIAAPMGGNNLIDGPALRWLAKHKGRKLWISDGGVTGLHGSRTDQYEDVKNIVTKNQIMRVDHQHQAMEVVTRKRPFKPTSRKDAVHTS